MKFKLFCVKDYLSHLKHTWHCESLLKNVIKALEELWIISMRTERMNKQMDQHSSIFSAFIRKQHLSRHNRKSG